MNSDIVSEARVREIVREEIAASTFAPSIAKPVEAREMVPIDWSLYANLGLRHSLQILKRPDGTSETVYGSKAAIEALDERLKRLEKVLSEARAFFDKHGFPQFIGRLHVAVIEAEAQP